jgi:hypothetical protein
VSRFVAGTSERIRQYGLRCLQLSELKRVAIENEDYLTAKQIKHELESIKVSVRDLDINYSLKAVGKAGTQELRQHIDTQKARLYGQATGFDGKPIN